MRDMTADTPSMGRLETRALAFAGITATYAVVTLLIGRFWVNNVVIQSALIPLVVSLIFSLFAWWHYRLHRLQAAEGLEQERIRQQHDRQDLFSEDGPTAASAASAVLTYHRYFIPLATISSALLLVTIAAVHWRSATNLPAPAVTIDALSVAGVTLVLSVFCLLSGSYINGVSREQDGRWLRPIAAWVYLSAAVLLLGAGVLVGVHFHLGHWDPLIVRLLLGVVLVLALELIANVTIECYRPRGQENAERPIHESRLLGLVLEPGGIAANLARTLDYQFGFTISESWFYRFLERTFLPHCLLLGLLLYGLDCIVLIPPSDLGIKERFGQPVTKTALPPGLYFKWPRPIERIVAYPAKQVLNVAVGYSDADGAGYHGHGDEQDKVILWNTGHYAAETNFLTASGQAMASAEYQQSIPVSVLSAAIPIFFRIQEAALFDYAYGYKNVRQTLENIAYRETVRYLASSDFVALVGATRLTAKQQLESRIRQAVAAHSPPLGVEILFVGLMDVHPSAEVAEHFSRVTAAVESMEQTVGNARRYADQGLTRAQAEAEVRLLVAEGYRSTQIQSAKADAERFLQQNKAFSMAPSVYRLHSYLELLEESLPATRTYVLVNAPDDVLVLDLKEQLRSDLLEAFNLGEK